MAGDGTSPAGPHCDVDELRAMAVEAARNHPEFREAFRRALIDYQRTRRAFLDKDELRQREMAYGRLGEAEREVMQAERDVEVAELRLRFAKIKLMVVQRKSRES
jgi:hypothetical protein